MDTWLKVDEFSNLVNMPKEKVIKLVNDGHLKTKEENGELYIEGTSSTSAVIPDSPKELSTQGGGMIEGSFAEKTIGTILSLHQKVLESKDETIDSIKSENQFLKDALFQMQEVYDEDKKTAETLREQLKTTQEELQFMKRKYKLMWGRVTEKDEKK